MTGVCAAEHALSRRSSSGFASRLIHTAWGSAGNLPSYLRDQYDGKKMGRVLDAGQLALADELGAWHSHLRRPALGPLEQAMPQFALTLR